MKTPSLKSGFALSGLQLKRGEQTSGLEHCQVTSAWRAGGSLATASDRAKKERSSSLHYFPSLRIKGLDGNSCREWSMIWRLWERLACSLGARRTQTVGRMDSIGTWAGARRDRSTSTAMRSLSTMSRQIDVTRMMPNSITMHPNCGEFSENKLPLREYKN